MFGSNQNSQQGVTRQYPVPAPETFEALREVIGKSFKVKSVDDFTMSATFSSGMSAWTYGENFTAQVVSVGNGSTVEVSGVGKVGGQFQQATRTFKLLNQLLDDLTGVLRARR